MELIYAIAAEPIALGQLVRPLVSEAPDESADEEPLRALASLTTARLFGHGL
jgi:hypothetical protein